MSVVGVRVVEFGTYLTDSTNKLYLVTERRYESWRGQVQYLFVLLLFILELFSSMQHVAISGDTSAWLINTTVLYFVCLFTECLCTSRVICDNVYNIDNITSRN